MPIPLALDSEAVIFTGLSGISFVTPNETRELVDTPADTLGALAIDRLTYQIETISVILLSAVQDPNLFNETSLELKDQGHSLTGTVYWFNRNLHFAVPKDPIAGAIVTYQQPGSNSIAGVRTLIWCKVSPD